MVRLFAVSDMSCEQPPSFSETFDRSNRSVGMLICGKDIHHLTPVFQVGLTYTQDSTQFHVTVPAAAP